MMKKTILFSFFIFILISCKKELVELEHDLQFQSNVLLNNGSYLLTINGSSSDITEIYKVKDGTEVNLTLVRDTTDSWLSGTIYLDGKAVNSYAGFRDTIFVNGSLDANNNGNKDAINLSYTVK